MNTKEGSSDQRDRTPILLEALRANILLLIAGTTWWGAHYSLLWDPSIAAAYSLVNGHDGRFILSVAGTVAALCPMALYAAKHRSFRFSKWIWSYPIFALCVSASYLMISLPASIDVGDSLVGIIGSVLSGVGGSFALILYGELHDSGIGSRHALAAFAIEIIAGIILFAFLSQIPPLLKTIGVLILVAASAALFATCSHDEPREPTASIAASNPDINLRQLVILALLTGLAYGIGRLFALSTAEVAGSGAGFYPECIGSCIGAVLLAVIYLFKDRQSAFEQCLMFVTPLVATGMLLISLQGSSAAVPEAINVGGFACFFNLIWYFAMLLESANKNRSSIAFYAATLFCISQAGQLIGIILPTPLINGVSTALIYLLLLVTSLFMYLRTKRPSSEKAEKDSTALPDEEAVPSESERLALLWAEELCFSPRESEVALLLMKRSPYRRIGKELFISENTVKTHVRNIYKKADVTSREELLNVLSGLAQNEASLPSEDAPL